MFVSKNLGVNEKNHLTIGGVDAVELAEQYGTPLYVMDEDLIRENCRLYRDSVQEFYGGHGRVLYASKAFCCKAICKVVSEEGLGVDVVSAGELHTALSAGVPAEHICFHGNNKPADEIEFGILSGVGRFVVDNPDELALLDSLAGKAGRRVKILLRITPGTDAHTHDFIKTGQIDSKFGMAIENGLAMEFTKAAYRMKNLDVCGIHCHIGSQIFELEPFTYTARVMLSFMADVRRECGETMSELNLGGGFGIKYVEGDQPVAYHRYLEQVAKEIDAVCAELDFPRPFIYLEPGRSIVGSAGVTLYTVGSVKEIPGIRTYVSVDGGMTDNPRYALYQAKYEVLVANRAGDDADWRVTVAGRCCESGDLIGENLPIQQVNSGDYLAVLATGAYNYSMSSNYNRVQKPAVVFLKGGKSRVAVRRESLDDILKNDLI
ncbi:diaminopimelate decarboxylase [Feifania hominis]|uniref:Diaminopimelate decarboxylase n=1 Tax=Feifania hominis TaxID=2763660 RepID=A0A926HUI6_9FIRM|nr:diaminopimelate decarboxylase [Feifania hominis]MBC8535596.1 diaminopimelate decarboxylase [Feifania hominis]